MYKFCVHQERTGQPAIVVLPKGYCLARSGVTSSGELVAVFIRHVCPSPVPVPKVEEVPVRHDRPMWISDDSASLKHRHKPRSPKSLPRSSPLPAKHSRSPPHGHSATEGHTAPSFHIISPSSTPQPSSTSCSSCPSPIPVIPKPYIPETPLYSRSFSPVPSIPSPSLPKSSPTSRSHSTSPSSERVPPPYTSTSRSLSHTSSSGFPEYSRDATPPHIIRPKPRPESPSSSRSFSPPHTTVTIPSEFSSTSLHTFPPAPARGSVSPPKTVVPVTVSSASPRSTHIVPHRPVPKYPAPSRSSPIYHSYSIGEATRERVSLCRGMAVEVKLCFHYHVVVRGHRMAHN